MFRSITRRAVIALACMLALPVHAQETVAFGDGLSALVPEDFTAQVGGGVLSATQSGAIRAPLNLTLRVDPDFLLHRRWLPKRRGDIRYTILNTGGAGSGGPVQELRATRQLPDGTSLALLAHQQAEFRPDFEAALDMLSSVNRTPQ